MHPIIRCLGFLIAGTSPALLAVAQPLPTFDGTRNTLHLEDAPRGKHDARTWCVTSLAFSQLKDGPRLFFTARDRKPWPTDAATHDGLWRWNVGTPSRGTVADATWRITRLPVEGDAAARRVMATPNGRFLVVTYGNPPSPYFYSGPKEGTKRRQVVPFLEVWDVEENKVIRTIRPTEENSRLVNYAALSPDGKTIALVEKVRAKAGEEGPRPDAWDQQVALWDVAKGTRVRSLDDLTLPLAFSPDGTLLAAHRWKDLSKMVLVDVKTGEVRATLARPKTTGKEEHGPWSPTAFHYAPTGNYIAGESWSGWVVWDRHGKIVAGGEPTPRIGPLCFLPQPDKDGKEWITWQEWAKLIGRDGDGDKVHPIMAASVDGKLIAAGEGRVIRVWNRKE